MEEWEKNIMKRCVGTKYIKKAFKKSNPKIMGAFNLLFLQNMLKNTKGNRVAEFLYILYDDKEKELYPAMLLLKKRRAMFIAPCEPREGEKTIEEQYEFRTTD